MIAATLFAGCGGSSLGYRAAGLEVRYACELDPWAAKVYELNAPGASVERCSVKKVTGAEIVARCGGKVDLLDLSPPCQSVSMAGRRRIDPTLFRESVRLAGEVASSAVVIENVEGLVRGIAKPLLCETMRGLERTGYRVVGRVLDASFYGVPQARRRVILIGFRDGLGIDPLSAFPRPRRRRSVIKDAIPDAARLIVDAPRGRVGDTFPRGRRTYARTEPAPTLMARGVAATSLDRARVQLLDGRMRRLTISELRALQGFPPDFGFPEGSHWADQWRVIGNAVPPPLAEAWARSIAGVLAANGALSITRTAATAR